MKPALTEAGQITSFKKTEESELEFHTKTSNSEDNKRFLRAFYSQLSHKQKTTLRYEVCKAFSIPEEVLFLKCRKREICNARQAYVYLIMTTDLEKADKVQAKRRKSPSALAKHIGQDHATVLHSLKVVSNYKDTEVFFSDLIDRLNKGLKDGTVEMPEIE